MASHPRLKRVGSRYHLRAKVPREIRPIIGKGEIWRSLETSDPRVALERLRIASVEVDAMFTEAKHRLRPELNPLTDTDIRRMVVLWFHDEDRKSAEEDCSLLNATKRQDALANLFEDEADLRDLYNPSTLAMVDAQADAILTKYGRRPPGAGTESGEFELSLEDTDWPSYERLRQLVHRAIIEHTRRSRARLAGKPAGLTFDPLFARVGSGRPKPEVPSPASITLADLIALYVEDPGRARSQKTRTGYVVIFRALKELLGPDRPAREISREDCRGVREVIMALPPNATKRFPGLSLKEAAQVAREKGLATLTPKSANSYLNNLASLFNWAVAEGYMEQNPATRLTVAVPKGSKKAAWRPFNVDQLNAIFSSPLYSGCMNDQEGYARPGPNVIRRGRFWVPLVALFTGMRLNEICQLRVDDVVLKGKIPVFLVRDDHPDQRVKSEAGARVVPVHPELQRCGFFDLVAHMGSNSAERLFPELPMGHNGYYSDPFAKWFQRFLEKSGAKRPRTSFHSFRHSFRDALREADIGRDAVLAIGGWANNRTEEIYGGGLKPSTLAKAVGKVRYQGLDLSHLHVS